MKTNRRKFVFGSLVSALLPALPVKSEPVKKPLKILEGRIAGFAYYRGEQVFLFIQPGDELGLKREPENAYDKRAIALYWQGQKIGFVPKVLNKAVSQLMDQGKALTASVTWKNGEEHEPLGIKIEVWV